MSKKELNNEEFQKKQQKQFSIGLCLGFFLFIIFIISQESSFFRNKTKIDISLIKTPNVINTENKEQKGLELQTIILEYEKFIDEIKELNLMSIKEAEFIKEKDHYKFVDENYTYYTNGEYLKLTRKDNDVYINSVEEGIYKYELYSDSHYILEYSDSLISFRVDDKDYNIQIVDSEYIIECNYEMNTYQMTKEIYDSNWNFTKLALTKNEVNYNGYFFEYLEGYSLSEDRLEIINDNNQEKTPSTGYDVEEGKIHYTLFEYSFNVDNKKDVLIVDSSKEFPLK